MGVRVRYDGCPGDFDGIAVAADQVTTLGGKQAVTTGGREAWIYFLFVSFHPVAGILLKRSTDPGHYTRIGHFDEYLGFVKPERENWALEPYSEDSFEIAEIDCNESDGNDIYTITIV